MDDPYIMHKRTHIVLRKEAVQAQDAFTVRVVSVANSLLSAPIIGPPACSHPCRHTHAVSGDALQVQPGTTMCTAPDVQYRCCNCGLTAVMLSSVTT